MQALAAQSRRQSAAEFDWDIRKCFEQVRRDTLVEAEVAYGYPLSLLRFSVRSYAWPRRLVWKGLLSDPLASTSGIIAGSGFALFELVLYVTCLVR